MNLLPKPLREDYYFYYSSKSVEELTATFNYVFNSDELDVNLAGRFISNQDFEIKPKWQFIIIRNYERDIAFVRGKIFQNESRTTEVSFSIRPNSIFVLFFFLFPVIGIFQLITSLSSDNNDLISSGLCLIILMPITMLVMGHVAKQNIRKRFVKVFELHL